MNPVIEVEGLTKTFGSFTAVSNVDMSIPENVVYGFLGPNGSGKTTAIRMMCGLLEPTAGNIQVLGMKVPEQAEEVRRQVGYMTQKFSLYGDLTVRQNLNFIGKVMGVIGKPLSKRIDELMGMFALSEFTKNLAGTLSGGQKRRLALAAAMLHKPKLLLLDEPTSEVDPNTRRDFWDNLFEMCEQGTTILVTTHLMDEAERCHHLAILDEGVKVADGTPDELKQNLGCLLAEVTGSQLTKIKHYSEKLEHVISATQVGLSLRVMIDSKVKDSVAYLDSELRSYEDIQIKPASPTMEDVFVMATEEKN